MYNQEKFDKEAAVSSMDSRLEENRDKTDNHATTDPGTMELALKKELHKNPEGELQEKRLDSVRKETQSVIQEKRLNDGSDSWLKTRDDSGIPLMDMYKEHEQKFIDALKSAADRDANVKNTDIVSEREKAGSQLLGPGNKKVKVDTKSQLLSNFDTRDEFSKANPSVKGASAEKLKTADSMLYHIFRTAAVDDRELTDKEQATVATINNDKIKILAQINDMPGEMPGEEAPPAEGMENVKTPQTEHAAEVMELLSSKLPQEEILRIIHDPELLESKYQELQAQENPDGAHAALNAEPVEQTVAPEENTPIEEYPNSPNNRLE